MEAKTHPPESIWFVTLTYDDEHIPGVNHTTGEVIRGLLTFEQMAVLGRFLCVLWFRRRISLPRIRIHKNNRLVLG
jgi:hypothetical protein